MCVGAGVGVAGLGLFINDVCPSLSFQASPIEKLIWNSKERSFCKVNEVMGVHFYYHVISSNSNVISSLLIFRMEDVELLYVQE